MEQRRQAMNSKEYNKKIADARRNESRKFGFRQSSYINFKVEAGYFFCLYFLTEEARLTVKPMYADELWWDIWNATENKNEPLSLRGTGAYSCPDKCWLPTRLQKRQMTVNLQICLKRYFMQQQPKY